MVGAQLTTDEDWHLDRCIRTAIVEDDDNKKYGPEKLQDLINDFKTYKVLADIKGGPQRYFNPGMSDDQLRKNIYFLGNFYKKREKYEVLGDLHQEALKDAPNLLTNFKDEESPDDRLRKLIGPVPKGLSKMEARLWLQAAAEEAHYSPDAFINAIKAKKFESLLERYLLTFWPSRWSLLAVGLSADSFVYVLCMFQPDWHEQFELALLKNTIFMKLSGLKGKKFEIEVAKLAKINIVGKKPLTKTEIKQYFVSTTNEYKRLYGEDVSPEGFRVGMRWNSPEVQDLAWNFFMWWKGVYKEKAFSPLSQGGGSPTRNGGQAAYTPSALIEHPEDEDEDER
jgi:hypothetical protein